MLSDPRLSRPAPISCPADRNAGRSSHPVVAAAAAALCRPVEAARRGRWSSPSWLLVRGATHSDPVGCRRPARKICWQLVMRSLSSALAMRSSTVIWCLLLFEVKWLRIIEASDLPRQGLTDFQPSIRRTALVSPLASLQPIQLPQWLQLLFSVNEKSYNVTLRRSPSILDPKFVTLRRHANFTSTTRDNSMLSGLCLFSGDAVRDDLAYRGWAALNICNDIVGIVQVGNEVFIFEPQHIIYRHNFGVAARSRRSDSVELEHVSMYSLPYHPLMHHDSHTFSSRRVSRAIYTKSVYVELAIFVDLSLQYQMSELYGEHTEEEITKFVMAMVNAMELLYDDADLGRPVRFVLKRLELLETSPAELDRQRDINTFLTNFCHWQREHNPVDDGDPLHWDHAVLLTGMDLYTSAGEKGVNRQVVGFAPVGGMCSPFSSCTVNEGKDFESVYIVSHEIGHSFGMQHDGQGNSCDSQGYIMSPTLGTGKNTWSSCSRAYLDRFVSSPQARCLFDGDSGDVSALQRVDSMPGERIGADEQCRLRYGIGSSRAHQQALQEICANLHCRYEQHRWTSHPALEGTPCGYDSWCRRGQCTARSVSGTDKDRRGASSVVDGGWGDWSGFSSCASSCLYGDDGRLQSGSTGLRERSRICNNPYPRNGGAPCQGGARLFDICPAASLCRRSERRSVQEYAEQICGKAARHNQWLTGSAVVRVSSDIDDACSVWCRRHDGLLFRHTQSLPNGARCSSVPDRRQWSSMPQYCVSGRCETFVCDSQTLYSAGEACKLPPLRHALNGLLPVGEDYRKRQWSDWRSYSRCRFSCIRPAQGVELVQRHCLLAACDGLERSVRHCTPRLDGTDCSSLTDTNRFASRVCERYRDSLGLLQLSGVGLQLPPTARDPDRSCTVTCQDRGLSLRFYRVKGREGWFPSGVVCSAGEINRSAYCLSGRCIDFDSDGTPLHDARYDYAYLFEAGFRYHRVLRRDLEGTGRLANLTRSSSGRIRGSVDRQFLQQVIEQLNLQDDYASRLPTNISADDIDLDNPVMLTQLPQHVQFKNNSTEMSHAFVFQAPPQRVDTSPREQSAASYLTIHNWKCTVLVGLVGLYTEFLRCPIL